MYIDENNYTIDQLKEVSEWFIDRVEQCSKGSTIDSISFSGRNTITITCSWEDSCRGCYMGTITESYTIPNSIFFSDANLYNWLKEEEKFKKKVKEREKEREEKEKKRKKELEELEEYKRLKAKYE